MSRPMSKSKPAAQPKFGELPPERPRGARRRGSAWVPVLRKLMKRPGEWALIGESTTGGVSGVKKIAAALGVFEVVTRSKATRQDARAVDVWARYVGPHAPANVPEVPDVTVAGWEGGMPSSEKWADAKPLHGLTVQQPVAPLPTGWRADASLG